MTAPAHIQVTSDGNVLVLVNSIAPDSKNKIKETMYHYQYTTSTHKLGQVLSLYASTLQRNLRNGIMQVITDKS